MKRNLPRSSVRDQELIIERKAVRKHMAILLPWHLINLKNQEEAFQEMKAFLQIEVLLLTTVSSILLIIFSTSKASTNSQTSVTPIKIRTD